MRGAQAPGDSARASPNAARPISVATNLRRDAELLEDGRVAARAAETEAPALTYGIGVRGVPSYAERARARGVPVLRRTTGGSGVLLGAGDLVWAVVRPRSDPAVGPDFARAYARLGAGVVRFLGTHGVAARWEPAPALAPDLCVLSGRGQVLVAGNRVLGGAAQHATARALLHHGMIARHVDRSLLAALFDLAPSVLDRLVGLEELGVPTSEGSLASELAAFVDPGRG